MKRLALLFLIALSTPVLADNIVRQVKDALKRPQKREQVIKYANQLLAEAEKPGLKQRKRVDCLLMAAECSKVINNEENVKLYLKKPYDTVVFFSSIRDIFERVLKADSISVLPDEKGRVTLAGRKRHRELLLPYRSNLLTGGMWHYQRGHTRIAYDFFDSYIDAATHPIFEQDSLLTKDKQLATTAYLAVFSAQKEGLTDGVIKHAALAKLAGQRADMVQEYYARAWESKGDTVRWLSALHEGIRSHAQNLFFFTHLLNYYTTNAYWQEGLALADSLATAADTVPLFWYAKSLMLLRLDRDREAVEACDACLKLEPDHANALYNKGMASLNLAAAFAETACTDMKNPQFRKDQETLRQLYRQAKEPMERLRKLEPNDPARWAPALYRIYLHLNMGKEFDEIDRLLKKVRL